VSRLRTIAVGALAAVLGLALLSVLAPGLVAGVAPGSLVPPPDARETAAAAVLPVFGVLALLAGVYVARRSRPRQPAGPLVESPVEEGASDAVDVTGRRFRYVRDWAAEQWHTPGTTQRASELEGRLRQTAIRTHATEADVDRETARQAVDAGEWTSDPVAAWFLAGAEGYPPGLWWVRERFRPREAYRTYVDRSAAAIDDLRGGGS